MTHATQLWGALPDDIREHWPGECGPGAASRYFPRSSFDIPCAQHDFDYLVGGTKVHWREAEHAHLARLRAHARAVSTSRVSLWWGLLVAQTIWAWTRTWGYEVEDSWSRRDAPLTMEELTLTDEYEQAQTRAEEANYGQP